MNIHITVSVEDKKNRELLEKILTNTEGIMSAISDFAAAVNSNFDKIAQDIVDLDALITKLQNSPGSISPADQKLLDDIQARSAALVIASAVPITGVTGPTNLVATPSAGSVALTWDATVGAASYNVKTSAVSGGPYTTATSSITNSASLAATSGTTVFYVVSSVDANSVESANSSEISSAAL